MTPDPRSALYRAALDCAASGIPVLPLRAGKRPLGNCGACRDSRCGDRPHMRAAGPCQCPRPCHGWAAATTDPNVLSSPAWARGWDQAAALAYHPGGADVTVVDLDNPPAIAWARTALPPTVTVATTRGEHWIYRGAMTSHNAVRPGVDIKSRGSYARWLGPGSGTMAPLPDAVRALAAKAAPAVRSVAVAVPAGADGACRHRVPTYLERGIAMAEARITDASSGVHATVYRVFLAVLSAHGRCGCLTNDHTDRLFAAAQAKGESPRHCAVAWSNARARLGL